MSTEKELKEFLKKEEIENNFFFKAEERRRKVLESITAKFLFLLEKYGHSYA